MYRVLAIFFLCPLHACLNDIFLENGCYIHTRFLAFLPASICLLTVLYDDKEFVPEPVMSVRRSQIQEMEERGDQFMRAGRYADAVLAYRKASEELGATAETYRKLAEAHALNQELPEAVSVYEKSDCPEPRFL